LLRMAFAPSLICDSSPYGSPAFAGTTLIVELGWIEPFAKPIALKDEIDGYRFAPPSLRVVFVF
jgi:hypothetical protein